MGKKKIALLLMACILLVQCAGGLLYWKTESVKPEYEKTVRIWSSREGAAGSRVSLNGADPVLRQEFVNQHQRLDGFVLFFYNCLQTDSGRICVQLKDGQGALCYEYAFEPAYMTVDVFCLTAQLPEECRLTVGETCVLEITAQDLEGQDYIEVGATLRGSKPMIFREAEDGNTLFFGLDYTYAETDAVSDRLWTAVLFCAAADVLLVLAWLWFALKAKKVVVSAVLIGVAGWIAFAAGRSYVASRKWYARHDYIAHAMGSIDGNIYSNSKEAFELSYQGGHRVFEVDFSMTSDGKIVLKHDWQNAHGLPAFENGTIPTLEQFKNAKIWGKYSTLDIKDLLELMIAYPDIFVVTDSKSGDYKDVVTQFSQIEEILQSYSQKERRSILRRLVVQIYNDDMYAAVRQELPAENFIYTIYQRGVDNLEALAAFCVENKIPVVTMPYSWWTAENAEMLSGYGLEVWVHEVPEGEQLPESGIDGVYTDTADLNSIRQP